MSIRLHPKYGLNPTLIKYICPVTGMEWESNELALLGWNNGKKADKYTIMGYQISPEVQEKLDEGYIAGIVADPAKGTPQEPYRTGEVIYIKKAFFKKFFNAQVPDQGIAFIELEVAEHLKSIMP